MFCKNCGQQLAEGAAFCPNCGMTVTQPDTAPAASEQPAAEQGTAQQPPYTQPQQPYTQPQQPYGQPGYGNVYAPQAKPSMSWLIVNIVLFVLSGFVNIFSLIGLIFGAIGQSDYNKGNYADAESKTKVCKILGIISLVLFVLGWATMIFFLIAGLAAPIVMG